MNAESTASPTGWRAHGTLPALVLILIGTALRLWVLDDYYLDFDESMHFQVAKEPTLVETWQASRIHTHPPLIFLIYHCWLPLGDSEFMLRLPAVLFGALAAWLAFVWLRRLAGTPAALTGLGFLTISLPVVHAGIQMRSYTLLFCFLFLSLDLLERLRREPSARLVAALTLTLALAMLTHYSAAWFLLTLGGLFLVRVLAGQVPWRVAVAWAGGQALLAGLCGWLYLSHASSFAGTTTQADLWGFWLARSQFTGPLAEVKLLIVHLLRFSGFLLWRFWPLLAVSLVAGGWLLYRQAVAETGLPSAGWERLLLILFPVGLALALLHWRIYPLGPTRHSLWLLPFVTAALAVTAAQGFASRRRWVQVTCGLLVLVWFGCYTGPQLTNPRTKLTPETFAETVREIRERIPPGDTLIVDESTRNVLDYYLARDTLNRPVSLGDGLTEYQMDGRRVISVREFHFFLTDLRRQWPAIQPHVAADHVWVVYFGYEVPGAGIEQLGRSLQISRKVQRWHVADNEILRFELTPPASRTSHPVALRTE